MFNFQQIDGYNNLMEEHQEQFSRFLEKFSNGLGLDSRATLIPLGVYFVEHTELLEKKIDEEGEEYYLIVGADIESISKDNIKTIHHQWRDDEEFTGVEVSKRESTKYLRFEYEHQGRQEWLHVIDGGNQWY